MPDIHTRFSIMHIRLISLLLFISLFPIRLLAQDSSKAFSFGFVYNQERSYNNWIEISGILPNSPAGRQGLVEGDYITAVNQKATGTINNENLMTILKAAKAAGSITFKINDEKEVRLVPDTVILFKCVTGDCLNGFGRMEDYSNNRITAGNYINGKLDGYASIKPYKGLYLPTRFKGLESFKVREIEGLFKGTGLLSIQNLWMDGNVYYTGGLGKNGPYGKGTFTNRNIKYEGNFNEQGNMDGAFTLTLPGKEVMKRTYKNTRVEPLYGSVNELGQLIVPTKYVAVNSFSGGYAVAETVDDNLVILDKKGNEVGKMPNYYEKGGFQDGLCAVGKNGRWGFVNTSGQLVAPILYERPNGYKYEMRENYPGPQFKNGVAVVCRAGKFGTLSKLGKTIIPLIYDGMQLYNGNYTVVTKGNLQGVVDKTGKIIVPIKYQQIWVEDGGSFFRVKKYIGTYTYSLFNTNGEEILNTSQEHIIGKFENGFAFYKEIFLNRGIINIKGEKIKLSDTYNIDPLISEFVNGMAVVKVKDKSGVIDTKGNILLPFKYHYLQLYDGTATVTENKDDINSTILDVKGNIIYQTKNTKRITMGAGSNMYYQGYIVVSDDDKTLSILDKTGKLLYTAPKGATISYVNQQDVFMLNDNTGIYKFIQPNGKELCRFTHNILYYPGFKDRMAPVGAN